MPDEACVNPLFLQWVKEWWDTARERNSKGATTYKHAYDSLKACPIRFEHPSNLQQLRGFGPKICERLTEKLKIHCEENGLPMPSRRSRKRQSGPEVNPWAAELSEEEQPARAAKKPRKAKPYVPAYRSGAYALVLALSLQDENAAQVGMTKPDLIEAAQPHCDASFTAPPDPTKYYTAWASMKTLSQKELVYERGRPLKRYALTDEGWEVAKRIRELAAARGDLGEAAAARIARPPPSRTEDQPESKPPRAAPESKPSRARPETIALDDDDDFGGNMDDVADAAAPYTKSENSEYKDVVADGNAVPDDSALPHFAPIRLAPGSFTVELVLDVREVRAKTDRDYMQDQLTKKGCPPIMRSLELGDALWVARCNNPGWLARMGAESDEVVLDWIVERKRLDDLIGSIRDGRFHEQKFRLRRSGVKNVIYLVEEISMDAMHFQKYEESVRSAIASIQVVNGYFLKRTQMMDESIRYLASMTKLLKKVYEGKPLHVIPTKVLTAKNYLPLLKHLREKQPSASHHISYPAFASLVSKSDLMTLRDLYLKMLMCTRGVTGEKAIEIQKVWKTPYDFVKAFEQCGPGEEGKRKRADLVSDRLSHLVGRKKIPRGVCQKIAEVWGEA
ncbi:hypothetical protein QBC47DRAFT_213673 [Echria macrotheca]|uniref:Crossover junction endonuclease MUS81 n=1 Tax=Echria macrotheca TaxID=438768 RepID=A0AAJ0BC43_9PEZI|nr:hypothetical protein QBC47DRAFT_213673 [Echria macrotheca]